LDRFAFRNTLDGGLRPVLPGAGGEDETLNALGSLQGNVHKLQETFV
jgi:hypothetical protein